MLSLIVTHSRNRVIGFNSELPWLLNEVGITNEEGVTFLILPIRAGGRVLITRKEDE